jgi:25S rRNA (cytosine2278-C5)-methyltransferase
MVVTTVLNADFTNLDPQDERFKSVTHILLDPSCSGSGLIQRLEYDQDEQTSPTRLRNLATFQSRLLKHALSFPNVQRVVYSTCSYHAEENERVLQNVLHEQKEWRVFGRDEQPTGLKSWHRRGLSEECSSAEIAQACIRFEKGTDGTIGFFAVALVRNESPSNGNNADEDDEEEEEEEWQGIPS